MAKQNTSFATDIAAADWRELTPRLLAYALYRTSRHRVGRRATRTPEEYVQEAVHVVLEGRRLPPDTDTSVFMYLAQVIDELIRHDLDSTRRVTRSDA